MSKHTPGPWRITGSKTKYIEAPLRDGWEQEVCAVGPTEADNGYGIQHEANARLIAAAPDLLEALELVISNAESAVFEDWLARVCPSGDASAVQYDWLHSSDYSDFCDDWKEAHAAIDKATGEKC